MEITAHIYDYRHGSQSRDVEMAVAALIETVHSLSGTVHSLVAKVELIMVKQTEHAAELRAVKDQVTKSKAEILAKIAVLESAQGENTTPEVDAAMVDLKSAVQLVDDIDPSA